MYSEMIYPVRPGVRPTVASITFPELLGMQASDPKYEATRFQFLRRTADGRFQVTMFDETERWLIEMRKGPQTASRVMIQIRWLLSLHYGP